AAFRRGVEHHSLTKDRGHERVRPGLVEVLVRGAEEELVGVRPGQQDDRPPGQVEPAHVAALIPHPAHESYRIAAPLLQVPVCRGAGNEPGLQQGHDVPPGSASASLPVFSGASGSISRSVMWAPRGVETIAVTAAATSCGRRKYEW